MTGRRTAAPRTDRQARVISRRRTPHTETNSIRHSHSARMAIRYRPDRAGSGMYMPLQAPLDERELLPSRDSMIPGLSA